MFNEKFLEKVKNKEAVIGYTDPDWKYDMYDFMTYMNSHPEECKSWEPKNRKLSLYKMEQRSSTPDFAKDIIKSLRKTFYKNHISCYAFCGFTEYSKSFKIHKDKMDVFYLQVIGDVQWSLWNSHIGDAVNIKRNQGECYLKENFFPGKWIWVPRGTYHLVEPITPRVGFSFGIEGGPDPYDYL
jgi:hypothetical protein